MNVIDFERYKQQRRRTLEQNRILGLEEKLEDRLMQAMQALSENKYNSHNSHMDGLDALGYELLFYDPQNVLGLVGRAYGICKYDLERCAKYMEDAFASDAHKGIATSSFLHLADRYKYNWRLVSSEKVIPAIGFSLEHFTDDERVMEITLRLALHFRNFDIGGMIRGAYNSLRELNSDAAESYEAAVNLSVRQSPKLKLVRGEK